MTDTERMEITGRSLILYDGVCGLCNRVVKFLLRIDRTGRLRFTPLQSPLASEILSRFPAAPGEPEGVLLITTALMPDERLYRRFDAVVAALRLLGAPWAALASFLRLVPRPWREWSYGLIARHRYRLFGRFDSCPVPTEAQRSRILGL